MHSFRSDFRRDYGFELKRFVTIRLCSRTVRRFRIAGYAAPKVPETCQDLLLTLQTALAAPMERKVSIKRRA